MADYINIYGQDILAVASDPANPTVGQIWYNTTSNTLKGGGVTTAGAWATGNNMNTARHPHLGGCWYTNSNFSFWWYSMIHQTSSEIQKNMMETSWTTF
jgi:hypothetical protein